MFAQGLFFSVLSAHDEERKGRHLPYPAAGALGQPPRAFAAVPRSDDIELSDGDAGSGGVDQPAEGTNMADAALRAPQGDCSIADLRIGLCLARQTCLGRSALPRTQAMLTCDHRWHPLTLTACVARCMHMPIRAAHLISVLATPHLHFCAYCC